MMRIKYVCPTCQAEYDSESESLLCRSRHQAPTGELNAVYANGEVYPRKLLVRFADGKEVSYIRGADA